MATAKRPRSGLHKVSTTIQPEKTIEVDDDTLADLKAQGLIVEGGTSEKGAAS